MESLDSRETYMMERARYAFDLCINTNFDEKALDEGAKAYQITKKVFKRIAYDYYLEAMQNERKAYEKAFEIKQARNNERKREQLFLNSRRAKLIPLFDELKEIEDEEQIIELLSREEYKEEVRNSVLREAAYGYVYCISNNLSVKEKNDLCTSLRKKLALYGHKKTKDNRYGFVDNLVDCFIAKRYIFELIGKYNNNIELFCKANGMKSNNINHYLYVLKKYDELSYKKYKETIRKNEEYKNIEIAKRIMYLIKNGIVTNGIEIRDFDILDYYLITNMSFHKTFTYIRKFKNIDDIKTARNFFEKYRFANPAYENLLLRGKLILNIDNVQKEISYEEKTRAITYLKENNIPLLEPTYSIALRRILNGEIKVTEKDEYSIVKRR
jgi:hypothetical protein